VHLIEAIPNQKVKSVYKYHWKKLNAVRSMEAEGVWGEWLPVEQSMLIKKHQIHKSLRTQLLSQ
jgi:hypothetical protein